VLPGRHSNRDRFLPFVVSERVPKQPTIYIALIFSLAGCAHIAAATQMETCESNLTLQKEKTAELIRIVQEDQADRSGPYGSINWSKVNLRDLSRRIQVATIFAEGCFKIASDYASAAMVFQHGTTPDHFYQTFHWANQAVKLGDESQRWLTGAGLDRYLAKIGHKQLLGTQFSKDPNELSRGSDGKWCLQPVEPTFPETLRIEYIKRNLKDNIAHVLKEIGSNQSPEEIKDCNPALKSSPKGTVPGFW
jgi:hypothetical protein